MRPRSGREDSHIAKPVAHDRFDRVTDGLSLRVEITDEENRCRSHELPADEHEIKGARKAHHIKTQPEDRQKEDEAEVPLFTVKIVPGKFENDPDEARREK